MDTYIPIKVKGKVIKLHKAFKSPIFSSRNVLTNSPWDFVELWLKRNKLNDSLFFWNQAREFHKASSGLPIQSAPLLHYYSFMNAVKCLLSSKTLPFSEYHGVKNHKVPTKSKKISLVNTGVKILNNGVLPSLSSYFEETDSDNKYNLKELLFNLPYVHRTFCLTYRNQTDMYIPIKKAHFVFNGKTKQVFFRAVLSNDYSNKHVLTRLPSEFQQYSIDTEYIIHSKKSISFSRQKAPTDSDIKKLQDFHKEIRQSLFYINGASTLWYIKSNVSGPKKIKRYPTTITLAIMHKLSELSRYCPLELDRFLSSQQNWLISEFIQQAPMQFFDEIASEITGHQFLMPNVRVAT